MLKAVELRKGRTILYEGELYVVHEAQHVAKGNKRSYMQTKLKNYKSGTISEIRFNVDDRLEVPFMESKEYEFLYCDGSAFIFMDTTTFDQIPVDAAMLGDGVHYLKSNTQVQGQLYDGNLIGIELPLTMDLEVTDTSPSIKGATATNQLKEAILETGLKIRVPPFIETGEKVKVDTRTGDYIERAK